MKTSELLSHIAKDMLDDRTDKVSGGDDSMFSDALIVRYLNEAERLLCRRAWVLEDTTTAAACRIALVENKFDYPVHPKVLFVKSVRLSDSDLDLLRVSRKDSSTLGVGIITDPDFWDTNILLTESAGRPDRFALDVGTRRIRVRRKPDATAAALRLHLEVVRMPITGMSTSNCEKEPEVPEEFHMDLALYAAGKCLSHPLVDAGDRRQGKDWLDEFEAKVREAKRDRQRFQQSEPQHRFGGWAGG